MIVDRPHARPGTGDDVTNGDLFRTTGDAEKILASVSIKAWKVNDDFWPRMDVT